jgi:hypothetical protein
MGALGTQDLAGEALAGDFKRARPYVNTLTPIGAVTASTVTATWSYSSPIVRAQAQFQVQLRNANGTVVLYDSMIQDGAGTSFAVPYVLSGGSSYRVYVRATDGFDWSLDPSTLEDWSWELFTSETVTAEDFPENSAVGSVYEIGINGVGYMLADGPDNPVVRRTATLQPPRFVTGDTPFAEAIEHHTFLGYSDFKNGAGQLMRSRTDSDPARFWDSLGINPFDDDSLQLLPQMSNTITGSHPSPRMAVANDRIYLVTAAGQLKSEQIGVGGDTTFSITGAGDVASMTSDGFHWYYADGASIYRNSTATDPTTAWSTVNAELIEWASDRLAAVYVDAGSPTMRCLTTLAPDGTEEVAGGRFKYPSAEATIPSITSGDGYLWFIVNRADTSAIHYWQLGSADTYAAVGLQLPAGQTAQVLGFYLGNVFVKATERKSSGGYRNYIYRCVPNEGRLVAELVLTFDTSAADDPTKGGFAGQGRRVLFAWPEMTDDVTPLSGVGAIDLSTGGWCRWIWTVNSAGPVFDLALYNGMLQILTNAGDIVGESTLPLTSGWIRTSHDDLGSVLQKVVDQYSITTAPLPSGGSVSVLLSLDVGNSYSSVGPAMATVGSTTRTWLQDTIVRTAGIEITITSNGATSPKVRHAQLRLHPLLISDQLLQLPVNCADQLTGLNGQLLPVDSPGAGLKRARVLEQLIGTQVKLQDLDWPLTKTSSIWEVVDAQTVTTGVFDKHQSRRVDSAVTTLTLRRSVS